MKYGLPFRAGFWMPSATSDLLEWNIKTTTVSLVFSILSSCSIVLLCSAVQRLTGERQPGRLLPIGCCNREPVAPVTFMVKCKRLAMLYKQTVDPSQLHSNELAVWDCSREHAGH